MNDLYRIDERWLKQTHILTVEAVDMLNEGYGYHAFGIESLVPLVPVVLDRLTQHSGYLDHLIRYFGPCGASCDSEINQHDEVCVAAGILTDVKWLIGENE